MHRSIDYINILKTNGLLVSYNCGEETDIKGLTYDSNEAPIPITLEAAMD